ncbi:MAG: TIGR01212 family radical SAM protein, partial [bacterium]
AARASVPIQEQVQTGIEYLKQRVGAKAFIVYFQPYSNTYASLGDLKPLYQEALEHPDVVGLSVGTRPDCVDEAKLAYLQELSQEYFVTIEYGIETAHDETLQLVNRGHDYSCTVEAIKRTANRGIYICGHVILGFPNETEEQMLNTADEVSKLPINFLKIHNLHIVRHTEMAREYFKRPFHLFSFEEWVDLVCRFLERLSPHIIVERLHGEAPKDLLIAPLWGTNGSKIILAIQQQLKRRNTFQGRLVKDGRIKQEDG